MLSKFRDFFILVMGFKCFEIGGKHCLRINYNLFVIRQLDYQIGTQTACSRVYRFLLDKIAMFHHPGQFHHAPQLDLAPSPPNRRFPQRFYKVGRFAVQFRLGCRQGLDLFGQTRVGVNTLFFNLPQLVVRDDVHKERIVEHRCGAEVAVPSFAVTVKPSTP